MNHILTSEQSIEALWSALKGRLRPALRLDIGGRLLEFESLADLDFCLAPRVGVLPARLSELLERGADELKADSVNLRNLELRLSGILEDFDRHGLSCIDGVAAMGLQVISKDFDWRAILTQLLQAPPKQEFFVRLAVSRYLQYLGTRQNLLRLLVEMKEPGVGRAQGALSTAAGRAFAPDKSTMAFDADACAGTQSDATLCRLPQGEAVVLHLENGGEIAIKLAKYKFYLAHSRDWALIADNGKRYVLHEGINSVGRSRDNDVPLDADFSNVSRKHLMAEPVGADAIVLTDLSSYGTYIPQTALAS